MVKRDDGRWQEKIKLPGMDKPKYFYGKTQREVQRQIAAWKGQQAPGGKLFADALDAWDAWHEKEVTYNGHNAYRASEKDALEYFEGKRLEEIDSAEVDAFITWVSARGYARRTVQSRLDLVSMVFDYAIVKRWATSNPTKPVTLSKSLKNGKREFPEDDILDKAAAAVHNEFGLYPAIAMYAGLRRAEILALKWRDIDRKAGIIHVTKGMEYVGNHGREKTPKTDAGVRDVPIVAPLLEVLPEKNGRANYYVFGGENPMTAQAVRKAWERWCRYAGLAEEEKRWDKNHTHFTTKWKPLVTAHQLRHAFCTYCFDAGLDVMDTKDLMGHSSVTVTQNIYTHIRQQRKQRTTDKLNGFFEKDVKKVSRE